MKILLISTEFLPGPGGIGTHAFQLAYHLSQDGCEVRVLSPQDYATEEEITQFSESQPFDIIRARHAPFTILEALNRLIAFIRCYIRFSPHIVIASGERAVWLTALLAQLLRFPWLAVGHGTEFGGKVTWKWFLTRWAFQQAMSVVCVSSYTAQRMVSIGIRPQWHTVIHNGAASSEFYPIGTEARDAFRQQHGLGNGNLLLTVGNVTERKGQDVVIRALPDILNAVPNVEYVIIGLPTLQRPLIDLAKRLEVADRVHFLGRVDVKTLAAAYNACDIFVMTSRHTKDGDFEGYGIAVVEAALCGKPAVVSEGAGLVEAIAPEQTGLAVPADDPRATASAIIRLLSDEALRQQLGQQARSRALEHQTWDSAVSAYKRVLQETASHHSRPSRTSQDCPSSQTSASSARTSPANPKA